MGLQHGDLKPLNILLRGDVVKLCDFGSSKLLQHQPAEIVFTGTLPYMAPELLLPSTRADAPDTAARAVDVYSFGVCLWEACTRRFPWRKLLQQGLVHDLKRRVGREGERPPTDLGPQLLPRPLLLLLEACWRQHPPDRPTFAQLAALDVEHLCTSPAAEQQLVDLIKATEGRAQVSSVQLAVPAEQPPPRVMTAPPAVPPVLQ